MFCIFFFFRRTASNVPDIASQIEVFDEQQECDVAQSLQEPNGIDLNSHLDVFNAILAQVRHTLRLGSLPQTETAASTSQTHSTAEIHTRQHSATDLFMR